MMKPLTKVSMGRKLIDLTGRKFGRLTVVGRSENIKGQTRWNCNCECGKKTVVYGGALRLGTTCSCGCLAKYEKKMF